jgi:deazaflavin-dependent oxidoreductase (nitroreductase family)
MLGRLIPIDRRPSGWRRWLLDLPLVLDRLHLNVLLGDRFVVVVHRGRRSGRVRRTALEVVRHHPATGEVVVASGWGAKSGWYRNLQAAPALEIHHGRRRFRPFQRFLSEAHAARAMRAYVADHPAAARVLGRWMTGSDFDGSPEAVARLVARVPFVAFRPGPFSASA